MPHAETLPVVADWFSLRWVTGRTAVLTEPYVDDLIRANIWYLRGRDRDLVVDAGNGIGALAARLRRLAPRRHDRELICLCTHGHIDHVGGLHEFTRRLLHPDELPLLDDLRTESPLSTEGWSSSLLAQLADNGFVPPPLLLNALPFVGFDPVRFRPARAAPTHLVRHGDEIDLGGRRLTVVGLPGHTPGSIGVIDHGERALLSGDAVYEGSLIDALPECDIDAYLTTMEALRHVTIDVVYPGHGRPFARTRLRELAEAYLRKRGR
jgi:glyoxylase-like metal-dependent hydrolase (beta-lactamase superfamily II)